MLARSRKHAHQLIEGLEWLSQVECNLQNLPVLPSNGPSSLEFKAVLAAMMITHFHEQVVSAD